ncbi:hypothetical protein VaNZ11_014431 [Volvox africanus]|uniref:Uncharacterized protein n=1 Tax=Volvox africanus TaxID=51714 RepID=A0ABQ5SIG0_9CHLO|nr:hypothetical protein VaNZ11_014431 [Volvox africanus]
MSSSIGNDNSSVVPQDKRIAGPRVPYPVCPSSAQSSCAQQCLMITSAEKVGDLESCDKEVKEVLKGAAEVQACTSVIDMKPPSAKIDRPAPHARFAEYFERGAKLKDSIFECQLFCARAAWRAQKFQMQGMEPELRTTCERVAHVRQLVAELEMEAAVRREDKLRVEMDVRSRLLETENSSPGRHPSANEVLRHGARHEERHIHGAGGPGSGNTIPPSGAFHSIRGATFTSLP